MSESERHWIDNIADVISGRMHNTITTIRREILSLRNTVSVQQKEIIIMTQNEQTITDAANTLSQAATELQTGISGIRGQLESANAHIEALQQQITDMGQTPPSPPEDLSQEFTGLDAAVQGIKQLADSLVPASAGIPATSGGTADSGTTTSVNPIDHGDNPPIGIGVGSDPPSPGSGGTNLPEGTGTVEPAPVETPGTVGTEPPTVEEPAPATEDPAPPVVSGDAPVAPAETPVPDDDFE